MTIQSFNQLDIHNLFFLFIPIVFGIFQIAGSRGGLAPGDSKPHLWRLRLLKDLVRGIYSRESVIQTLVDQPGPRHLTIASSNACNLSCRHCYLQVKPSTGELTEMNWRKVIEKAVQDLPIEVVSLVGKEPFIDSRGPAIIEELARLRVKHPRLRFGVVTNGTLLKPFRERLSDWRPNFLDISLEGIGRENDRIRGKGSFAMVEPNLQWFAKEMPEQLFVIISLTSETIDNIFETLQVLSCEYGVRKFGLGFFIKTHSTLEDLSITKEQLDHFTRSLIPKIHKVLPRGTTVVLDADMHQPALIRRFVHSMALKFESLKTDGFGEAYWELSISSDVSIYMKLGTLPTGIWESVRILPNGHIITSDDTLEPIFYNAHSLGRLLDFNLRLSSLLASSDWRRLINLVFEEFETNFLTDLQLALHEMLATEKVAINSHTESNSTALHQSNL